MEAANSLAKRACQSCEKIQPLTAFHLKPNGKFGRDSRCKACVIKAKRTARRLQKKRSRYVTTIHSEIVGKTDEYSEQEFGTIFGRAIADLLEKGWLK
jgi:hypothetical protein